MKLSLLLSWTAAASAVLAALTFVLLIPGGVSLTGAVSELWDGLTWSPMGAAVQLLAGAVLAGAVVRIPALRTGSRGRFLNGLLWAIAIVGVLSTVGGIWSAWDGAQQEWPGPLTAFQFKVFLANALWAAPLKLLSTAVIFALIWLVYDRRADASPSGA